MMKSFLAAAVLAVSPALADQYGHEAQSAQKINEAGWSLLRHWSGENGGNIALSPPGIAGIFAPLQSGAKGETRRELDDVLGPHDDYERLAGCYDGSGLGMILCNLLLADDSLPLRESFTQSLGRVDLMRVGMRSDPGRVCGIVNEWAGKHSFGKITDLMSPVMLRPGDELISLSASTFDMKWRQPLESGDGETMEFDAGGNTLNVPAMRFSGVDSFHDAPNPYAWINGPSGSDMLCLPYLDEKTKDACSSISMIIVMPRQGQKLGDFIQRVSSEEILRALEQGRKEEPRRSFGFIMPKFTITTPVLNLQGPLSQLGMTRIFDPSRCDLGGMSEKTGLYVSAAYCRNYIHVDEFGTRAASVGIGLVSLGGVDDWLLINRPFAWLIYDQTTHLILFCGTVTEPAFDGPSHAPGKETQAPVVINEQERLAMERFLITMNLGFREHKALHGSPLDPEGLSALLAATDLSAAPTRFRDLMRQCAAMLGTGETDDPEQPYKQIMRFLIHTDDSWDYLLQLMALTKDRMDMDAFFRPYAERLSRTDANSPERVKVVFADARDQAAGLIDKGKFPLRDPKSDPPEGADPFTPANPLSGFLMP